MLRSDLSEDFASDFNERTWTNECENADIPREKTGNSLRKLLLEKFLLHKKTQLDKK